MLCVFFRVWVWSCMCWCAGPCPSMGTVFLPCVRELQRAASEYHSLCHKVKLSDSSLCVQCHPKPSKKNLF